MTLSTIRKPCRHRHPRSSNPALAWSLLLGGLVCIAPVDAAALEDEWSLGGGPLVASIPTEEGGVVGFGANAFVRYGLSESLALSLGCQYSYHLPPTVQDATEQPDALQVFFPKVGVFYAIDVIDLVPYFEIDATAYLGAEKFAADPVGFGLAVAGGLEYRRWRELSFGLEIGYHALLSDIATCPIYTSLGIVAAWHSDPF